MDGPAEAVRVPRQLVISADRNGIWYAAAGAWGYILLGLLQGSLCLFVMLLLLDDLVSSSALYQVLDKIVWLAPTLLLLFFLTVLAFGIFLFGCHYVVDAWRLERIRLVIDERGISQTDKFRTEMSWDQIRHVAVTSGSVFLRRLLVDGGTMPASWWFADTINHRRAVLRLTRPRRPRRFEINAPIDRFNVGALDILWAIHHHSGGRFPDRGSLHPGGDHRWSRQ